MHIRNDRDVVIEFQDLRNPLEGQSSYRFTIAPGETKVVFNDDASKSRQLAQYVTNGWVTIVDYDEPFTTPEMGGADSLPIAGGTMTGQIVLANIPSPIVGDGSGLTGVGGQLTVSNMSDTFSAPASEIKFNDATGFNLSDLGDGKVGVSLGSGFKTIHGPAGQDDIVAVGEDEFTIEQGSNVTITTNATTKTITVSSTGLGGDATSIQGIPVTTDVPTNGQVLSVLEDNAFTITEHSTGIPNSITIGVVVVGNDTWYSGMDMGTMSSFILKVTSSGNVTRYNPPAGFYFGLGTYDGTHLWFADLQTSNIIKVQTDGTIWLFDVGDSSPHFGISYVNGFLYLSAMNTGNVLKLDITNPVPTTLATGLMAPGPITLDSNENLWMPSFGSNNVYKVTMGGAVSTIPIIGITQFLVSIGNYTYALSDDVSTYSIQSININTEAISTIFSTAEYLQPALFSDGTYLWAGTSPFVSMLKIDTSGNLLATDTVVFSGMPGMLVVVPSTGKWWATDPVGAGIVYELTEPAGTKSLIWTSPGLDDTKLPLTGGTMSGELLIQDTPGTTYLQLRNTAGPIDQRIISDGNGQIISYIDGQGDVIDMQHSSAGNVRLSSAGHSYINTTNANHNFGLGTASPSEKLDVVGNIKSSGYFIGDGSQLTNVGGLPSQSGHNGEFLTTDGNSPSWSAIEALPDQTNNAGKILTTDGSTAAWSLNDDKTKLPLNGGTVGSLNVSSAPNVWTDRVTGGGGWLPVVYGNPGGTGIFVTIANGSNAIKYSYDGTTWSDGTCASSEAWISLAYGNGKFVAVATGYAAVQVQYSTDGINWTAATPAVSEQWTTVAFGGGVFTCLAYSSINAQYSFDGINWTPSTGVYGAAWTDIAYGNNKFVAIPSHSGGGPTTQMQYSYDGISWTSCQAVSSQYWSSIEYGNGKFVAVSNSQVTMHSTDGIHWTQSNIPWSYNWRSLVYGNGKFIAFNGGGSDQIYSYDGVNWTISTIGSTAGWNGSAYGEPNGTKIFVVVSQNEQQIHRNIDSSITLSNGVLTAPWLYGNGSQLTGIVKWVSAPSTATDPGNAGDIAYDNAGNFYVCYASGNWSKFTPGSW